tara:strand:- start:366 stop:713 length:348 start_codon:yes stop_codon:yes gene_type:complete
LRLKQILLKLLSNAVKFMPKGGTVFVSTVIDDERDEFIILTKDTRVGMYTDDIPRIFEPFIQIANPNFRNLEGTGLGLTLAKAFVEMHAGSLTIESEKGIGKTVSVRLPARRLRD